MNVPTLTTVAIGQLVRMYLSDSNQPVVATVIAMTPQLCVGRVAVHGYEPSAVRVPYRVGDEVSARWECVFALVAAPAEAVTELTMREDVEIQYRPTVEAPPCIRDVPGLTAYDPLGDIPKYSVYFLCLLGELVYVGQSVDLSERIVSHRDSKRFDAVFFIGCEDRASMIDTERANILKLQPVYNRTHNRSGTQRRKPLVFLPQPEAVAI